MTKTMDWRAARSSADGRFLFRRRLFRWTMRPGAFWLPLTAALRKRLLTARPLMGYAAVRTRRESPVTLSPFWRKCLPERCPPGRSHLVRQSKF